MIWPSRQARFSSADEPPTCCLGIASRLSRAKIKCSICSSQFNTWDAQQRWALVLIVCLNRGRRSKARFVTPTGCPGIAVPPGSAHTHHRWVFFLFFVQVYVFSVGCDFICLHAHGLFILFLKAHPLGFLRAIQLDFKSPLPFQLHKHSKIACSCWIQPHFVRSGDVLQQHNCSKPLKSILGFCQKEHPELKLISGSTKSGDNQW